MPFVTLLFILRENLHYVFHDIDRSVESGYIFLAFFLPFVYTCRNAPLHANGEQFLTTTGISISTGVVLHYRRPNTALRR